MATSDGSWAGSQPLPLYLAANPPTGERNRLTCGLRLIWVIPQIIVLFFLGIAAFVVLVIGWFGALITGRLPQFAEDFLSGVLRWSTRVYGYFFFLTDDYPPYSLEPEEQYPIVISIPPPDELNRLSVLFRIFLAIPAAIVTSVVVAGLEFVSIASWAVILFTGELPDPLYDAARAVMRYATRYYGWFAMLTAEYAWGLLGDVPSDSYETPAQAPAEGASGWTIRLTSEARTVMIVIIVIGAIVTLFNGIRYR
ncbi:MAG TPA: DUF4389 domain-containing protein [Acidimicrobiales bacterium]|nr:DUF4389 domain-containing protein [Acidimicrobiales bacterium]